MHPAVVADAGGLLVLAGLLEGIQHPVDEIVALDCTSLLIAEYLALRHEGSPQAARTEFGLAIKVVQEWFPVRAVAIEAAVESAAAEGEIDASAALKLSESLRLPLVTKNRDLSSRQVPVLFT